MKLLFDQNLSHRLVDLLATEFPGSNLVRRVGLAAAEDAEVWIYALDGGFCIVSKDVDLQQRSLLSGHPPKVIWIRIGNSSTAEIVALIRRSREDIEAFAADGSAAFLTLS